MTIQVYPPQVADHTNNSFRVYSAEHEKILDAYSLIDEKLQHSLSEKSKLEKRILGLQVSNLSLFFFLFLSNNCVLSFH